MTITSLGTIPTVEEILARPDPPLSPQGESIVRRAYELAHRNRRTILGRIEQLAG